MKTWLKNKIQKLQSGIDFDVLTPPDEKLGDYSINLAFVLNRRNTEKGRKIVNPEKIGQELIENFSQDKDFQKYFSKIKLAGGGFINFYLKTDFLVEQLKEIHDNKNYGFNETMKGKTVMVEYTDPNPFKLFHIGHLMSNTIGESIAKLYETSGAKVLRVNYQGDVGLHVAKAIWALKNKTNNLEEAYALGSKAYQDNPEVKTEIEEINKKIYDRSDKEINELYDKSKKLSLEYFETIYKRLGTKFDDYFFESETGQDGLKIINANKKIFTESEGALIFKGEDYGLHSRVFINSQGLSTYEAKELGLNKKKFDKHNPDLSIIITGNEINDYFRVLLKVMELTMPEVAQKTRHIGHGMLRLSSGKMSSRTGEIITVESLIEQTKGRLPESEPEVKEKIAIGAIKYSILKQSPGHDIIFDFEKSLSVKGDSAPYIQYTYSRLASILRKSGQTNFKFSILNFQLLSQELELKLIKKILRFPDLVEESRQELAPQHLVLYIYELAVTANRFYEEVRVLEDENKDRINSRLMLIETTANILKRGLNLLGIEALEKI